MAALERHQLSFSHPTSEDEISPLIQRPSSAVGPIRVRGSAHSLVQAIYTRCRWGSRPADTSVS